MTLPISAPVSVIAGHQTALRRFGPEDGRPALALHCALAHAGAWAPLAALLPDWQITAPDLPGHGGSAGPGGQDFHALCTAIATEIATALVQGAGGGAPVAVIGHSLGATVALRLALEWPDLVASLTLIEPVLFAAAGGSEAAAENLREQEALAALIADDPEEAAARFQALWGAGLPFRALPERQRRLIASQMYLITEPAEVLIGDAAEMLRPGRLEGLTIPVLLAEGTESPAVVAEILDHLGHRIPGARRLRVEGAGHMLPITRPAPLADAMRALNPAG